MTRQRRLLSTQAQVFYDLLVACEGDFFEVVEEGSSFSDHEEESPSGVEIFFMDFEVFCEVLDSVGEECDLDFWRSGIGILLLKTCDDVTFCLGSLCGGGVHSVPFSCSGRVGRLNMHCTRRKPVSHRAIPMTCPRVHTA